MFNIKTTGANKLQKKIRRLPQEVVVEIQKQAIEKAAVPILRQMQTPHFGFRDRTGNLRKTMRLGTPRKGKYGVRIPLIAGRKYPYKGHYAGYLEFGTKNMFPRPFIFPAIHSKGLEALHILSREMERIIERSRL